MPNQSFFGVTSNNTVDDHVCSLKLLIATDYFIFSVLLIGRKHGEELENIHNLFRRNHVFHADLYISQSALGFVSCSMPRPPHVDWHVNGTISITFSFGSEVEYICYEHRRDAFFIGGDVTSCIQPSNRTANRRFQFADRNRKPVDK